MKNELIFLGSLFLAGSGTLLARKFGLSGLVAWISAQGIFSNIFVLKQIDLFGLEVTSGEIFTLSCLYSVTLLQEDFGKKIAQNCVQACFLALVFFAIGTQCHLAYLPSVQDNTQMAYQLLFGPNIRLVGASIFAYWLSQNVNVVVFDKLSSLYPNLKGSFKAFISLFVAIFVDTFSYAFIGLYGLVHHVIQIIFFSICIKLIGTVILGQFFLITQKQHRVVEHETLK